MGLSNNEVVQGSPEGSWTEVWRVASSPACIPLRCAASASATRFPDRHKTKSDSSIHCCPVRSILPGMPRRVWGGRSRQMHNSDSAVPQQGHYQKGPEWVALPIIIIITFFRLGPRDLVRRARLPHNLQVICSNCVRKGKNIPSFITCCANPGLRRRTYLSLPIVS